MNYFIVDDDPAVRGILKHLIESEHDRIVGEADDGIHVYSNQLFQTDTDILIIDLLMPEEDGIETIKRINKDFNGKIVMISQVETKEMIAEAYQNHVEAYITKPVNSLEVSSVLEKVSKNLKLERSMKQIKNSLDLIGAQDHIVSDETSVKSEFTNTAELILSDLGIRYEKGAEDLLGILYALEGNEISSVASLKDLWESYLIINSYEVTNKNIKSTEQRIRRTILQAFNHICSLGAMDITHPKFEYYAMRFFEMDSIQKRIHELNTSYNGDQRMFQPRINVKRFIWTLYDECKEKNAEKK
ncbi:DNA-binding domain-containing protein [Salisediminibacterium beveridgei]|uniref:Two-component response regulator, controling glutamine utilization n=1 Tax=Salisediminibacterium beveridgei TaxID=632773 RepID=A0A1D7QYH2_9BACI|nr:DNA-binding domain-containing protein [Salisediminibacterium beveridgei]AOM84064.1 Two-component response regulator, controling glutamine utilization [Salisediminibacterium beveridgei]